MRRWIGLTVGVVCLALAGLAFAVFIWPTYHWRPEQPCCSGILVLDLKGDGLQLQGKETYRSYFAHEGDWFFQATDWPTDGHDAILALAQTEDDPNIDGVRDLIAVLPSEVDENVSAFDKLAAFDANGDGLVDARDPAFARLRIWVDRDSDGLTDPGDLVIPAAAGVSALRVAHGGKRPDIAGNKVFASGWFLDATGQEKPMLEIGFDYDRLTTFDAEPASAPDYIMALPAMRGYGKMRGLRSSMTRDGNLFVLVQKFTFWFGEQGNDLAPRDVTGRVQKIVTQWSGTQDIARDSRGLLLDARHITTLERIRGAPFFEAWGGGANPSEDLAHEIESRWDRWALGVASRLLVQGLLDDCFGGVKWIWHNDRFEGTLQMGPAIACAARSAPRGEAGPIGAREAAIAYWKPVAATFDEVADNLGIAKESYEKQLDQAIRAGGVSEGLDFLRTHAVRQASSNPETAFAGTAPTLMFGSAGDDALHGGPADDLLLGGGGNDILAGGDGSDTYAFDRVSGNDVINDPEILSGDEDIIVFDAGIRPADIQLHRARETDGDLRIVVGGATTITVQQQLRWRGVESLRFADGTTWDRDEIEARMAH